MIRYTTVVFIIFIVLIILFACSPNSTDLAKRYVGIYNSHNVEKIVSLYTDDAVFEAVGQYTLSGKDQIRHHTEYYSTLNIHMSIFDIKAKGDTVSCNLSITNDWLKLSEIGEANYTVIFIFKDGLVKRIRAEIKAETQRAFSKVLPPLMEWAKENKADLLKEMIPEGKFIYNAENAKKALALLRSWRDSLNQ